MKINNTIFELCRMTFISGSIFKKKYSRFFFGIIILCNFCNASLNANVNLYGKVTRQGTGALDVVVTLLSAGISDTTDTSGNYKLFRQGTFIGDRHIQSEKTGKYSCKAVLCANGTMCFNRKGADVKLYNIQGRIMNQAGVLPGNAHKSLPDGIYLYYKTNVIACGLHEAAFSNTVDTLSLSNQGTYIKKIPVEKLDGSFNITLDTDLPARKHTVLVSSYSNNKAFILSADNKMEWEYAMPGSVQDAWALPNDNILLCGGTDVREVTRLKEVVWKYTANAGEIHNCQPLPGNVVLFAENVSGKLFEINRSTNSIVRSIQTACKGDNHTRFRMVRKTKDSTYLIAARGENNVYELNQDGKILRTIYCDSLKKRYGINWDALHSALKLDNGNILIGGGYNSVYIEVDKKDSVVWKLSASDIPEIGFNFAAAGQLLPSGTFVFGAYTSTFKLAEVTRSKKVIWKLQNPAIGNPTHVYIMDCWGSTNAQLCKPVASETLVR
ncbi:MAG TPA: hypothetical protein VHO70_13715 [Chitinispirillaceae bacterium]|nr:hypothetical protein [Chitinispirillaceae bacterium]